MRSQLLATADPKRVHDFSRRRERQLAGVAFMFPGQGAQYVNMGRTLYESEAALPRRGRRMRRGAAGRDLGVDLRTVLYPLRIGIALRPQKQITQTAITQPALFAIEYALAQLWMSWGIKPAAMIGHSVGEYVAACLGGTFTRDDALHLLAQRARADAGHALRRDAGGARVGGRDRVPIWRRARRSPR